LLGIGLYLAVTIPFYIQTVFMPSFMVKYLNFTTAGGLRLFTFSLMTMMIVVPISAKLADKQDRETLLKTVRVGYALFAIPYVMLLDYKSFTFVLCSQIAFLVILGAYIAPIPTLLMELFPTKTRYTGNASLGASLYSSKRWFTTVSQVKIRRQQGLLSKASTTCKYPRGKKCNPLTFIKIRITSFTSRF
jgi:hypothetical protein